MEITRIVGLMFGVLTVVSMVVATIGAIQAMKWGEPIGEDSAFRVGMLTGIIFLICMMFTSVISYMESDKEKARVEMESVGGEIVDKEQYTVSHGIINRIIEERYILEVEWVNDDNETQTITISVDEDTYNNCQIGDGYPSED